MEVYISFDASSDFYKIREHLEQKVEEEQGGKNLQSLDTDGRKARVSSVLK